MAEHTVELQHGLKYGDATHTTLVLKDHLTAGDIRAAAEASEKIELVDDGNGNKEVALLISPTRMANEILRRQIKSIGNVQGPLSLAELDKLHQDDLALINQVANRLLELKAAHEVNQRGRLDAGKQNST